MRLSCCFLFIMLPILLLGVILSEAKNLEDIRMGRKNTNKWMKIIALFVNSSYFWILITLQLINHDKTILLRQ